jgi:hypothetical protein
MSKVLAGRWTVIRVVLVFVAAAVSGCSQGASVQGNVTIDGQPMDGGRIFFLPDGEPNGRPTAHGTLAGGKYCISASEGLKPGKHRVEIVWHKPPPGKEHLKPGDPGFTTDNLVQTIPKAYNAETTLFEELKAGANRHNFELKSKP